MNNRNSLKYSHANLGKKNTLGLRLEQRMNINTNIEYQIKINL